MIILRGLDIFSDVKEEKRLSTSLISTRLVKWPKANIGHCFWPPKVHICIDRKKERGDAVRKRDHCSLEVSFIHYNI